MKKLTLSADAQVIVQAKRIAQREHTSVSAMFARFIRSRNLRKQPAREIPPDSLAARAAGFISLPKGKSPRDVLTEALLEKYKTKR